MKKGSYKLFAWLGLAVVLFFALVGKIVGIFKTPENPLPSTSGSLGVSQTQDSPSWALSRSVSVPGKAPPSFIAATEDGFIVASGTTLVVFSEEGTIKSTIELTKTPSATQALPSREAGTLELVVAYGNIVETRSIGTGPDAIASVRQWANLEEDARIVSIAVDPESHDVFLADAGTKKIHRYSEEGKLLGYIGQKDESRGIPGLVVPSPYLSIAISDGKLIVANPGRHGIETYAFDGRLVSSFYKNLSADPSTPAGLDGFAGCCNPVCIAVTSEGTILTVEKGVTRVKIFSPTGTYEGLVAEESLMGTSFFGNGAVAYRDSIVVLDRETSSLRFFAKEGV